MSSGNNRVDRDTSESVNEDIMQPIVANRQMVRDSRCYYTCVTAFDFDIHATTDLQFFSTNDPTQGNLLLLIQICPRICRFVILYTITFLKLYEIKTFGEIDTIKLSFRINLVTSENGLYYVQFVSVFIIQSNSSLNTLKDQYAKLESNPGSSYIPKYFMDDATFPISIRNDES